MLSCTALAPTESTMVITKPTTRTNTTLVCNHRARALAAEPGDEVELSSAAPASAA